MGFIERHFPTFLRWSGWKFRPAGLTSGWRTSPWWKGESAELRQRTLLHVLYSAQAQRCDPAPLIEGLANEHRLGYRRTLGRLAKRLHEGVPLADALEQTPGALSDHQTLAIRCGSQLGSLLAYLETLIAQRDPEERTAQRRLRELRLYGLTMVAALVVASAFMAIRVVPHIAVILDESQGEEPLAMRAYRALLGSGTLAGVAVALLLILGSRRLRQGRFVRRSLWGRLIPWVAALRGAGVLQLLQPAAAAGRPMTSAVSTLARYHYDPGVRGKLLIARNNVEQGAELAEALADVKLLSRSEARALSLAASSESRSWMLQSLAAHRQRRILQRLDLWLAWAQPLLVTCIAIAVALPLIAVLTSLIRLMEQYS